MPGMRFPPITVKETNPFTWMYSSANHSAALLARIALSANHNQGSRPRHPVTHLSLSQSRRRLLGSDAYPTQVPACEELMHGAVEEVQLRGERRAVHAGVAVARGAERLRGSEFRVKGSGSRV